MRPCRNSRFLGEPRTVTLDDGSTVVEQDWELTPGYGRTNIKYVAMNGFNPDTQDDQYTQIWLNVSEEKRRRRTDPGDPICPLSRFVGNERAKRIMQRAAYAAWGRADHCCADLSFAMVGPASAGKTTLARLFGETVGLPFIEIPPRGIRDPREFFDHIAVVLERTVEIIGGRPVSLKMVKPDPLLYERPHDGNPSVRGLHRRGPRVADEPAGDAPESHRVQGQEAEY